MSYVLACGLRCYTCTATDPKSCTDTKSCPVIFNRCFSLRIDGKLFFHITYSYCTHQNQSSSSWYNVLLYWIPGGYYTCHDNSLNWFLRVFLSSFAGYTMVTKGCQTSLACVGAIACCEGNLCNSVMPTGPCAILLLVSSAIITLFLWGSGSLLFLCCTFFWLNLYNWRRIKNFSL